jgi:hypothetical protein
MLEINIVAAANTRFRNFMARMTSVSVFKLAQVEQPLLSTLDRVLTHFNFLHA